MKGLIGAELIVILALLLVAWLLKVQAEQVALIEVELDELRGRVGRSSWEGRMQS